jgi:hypothetical protein
VAELISFGGLLNEEKKKSIVLEGYQNFGQLYVRQNLLANILAVSTQSTYSLLQSLQRPSQTNSIDLNIVGAYYSETSENVFYTVYEPRRPSF